MRTGPIDHRLRDRVEAGPGHRILMDDRHRRLLASAHAGRSDDPDIVSTQHLRQTCQQRGRAGEFAAQAFADPHGQRRRGSIAFEHLEVVIERRDLIDLGHRYRHFCCQRHQMMIAQPPVLIIEPMQMLDQQIPPMRSVADQGAHFGSCLIVGLTALELAAAANLLTHVCHGAKRDSGDRGRSHVQRTSLIARCSPHVAHFTSHIARHILHVTERASLSVLRTGNWLAVPAQRYRHRRGGDTRSA